MLSLLVTDESEHKGNKTYTKSERICSLCVPNRLFLETVADVVDTEVHKAGRKAEMCVPFCVPHQALSCFIKCYLSAKIHKYTNTHKKTKKF